MNTPTGTSNRILSGVRAMPIKDGSSDGTNTFSMFRRMYSETYTTGLDQKNKWYGNTANRDASRVATERRITEVGVGSLNASGGELAFTSGSTPTTQVRALHRLRNGGSVVPAKKTHSVRMF